MLQLHQQGHLSQCPVLRSDKDELFTGIGWQGCGGGSGGVAHLSVLEDMGGEVTLVAQEPFGEGDGGDLIWVKKEKRVCGGSGACTIDQRQSDQPPRSTMWCWTRCVCTMIRRDLVPREKLVT